MSLQDADTPGSSAVLLSDPPRPRTCQCWGLGTLREQGLGQGSLAFLRFSFRDQDRRCRRSQPVVTRKHDNTCWVEHVPEGAVLCWGLHRTMQKPRSPPEGGSWPLYLTLSDRKMVQVGA